MEWISCAVVYTVSYVSHGLLRSCTISNTIIHRRDTGVSFLSFENHTGLSRIYENGLSVTRIRSRLVRANLISRVLCVRQALVNLTALGLKNPDVDLKRMHQNCDYLLFQQVKH